MAQKPIGTGAGRHALCRLVDHSETYGGHVLDGFIASMRCVTAAADLGAGSGRDLSIVRKHHPSAHLAAIEPLAKHHNELLSVADRVHFLDIERDALPFEDETADLIMANQVLEHTKDIYWIFHEVTRSLKVGGHFVFGVPNVASLHNRLLLLFGEHPTQSKAVSAHVRPFSKNDTIRFVEACFPGGYSLTGFGGSQFYPLPMSLARAACAMAPTMAFSIFFMLTKQRQYKDGFVNYARDNHSATTFWLGSQFLPGHAAN